VSETPKEKIQDSGAVFPVSEIVWNQKKKKERKMNENEHEWIIENWKKHEWTEKNNFNILIVKLMHFKI